MPAGFLIRPSLEPVLEAVRAPREDEAPNRRTLRISALAIDLLEALERRLHARHRVERTIDLSQTLGWARPTER